MHRTKRVFIDGELLVNKHTTFELNGIFHLEEHQINDLEGYFKNKYPGYENYKFHFKSINLV